MPKEHPFRRRWVVDDRSMLEPAVVTWPEQSIVITFEASDFAGVEMRRHLAEHICEVHNAWHKANVAPRR